MYDDSLKLYPLVGPGRAAGDNQRRGGAGAQDEAVRLAAEEPQSHHAAAEGSAEDSFLDQILRTTPDAEAPLGKGVDTTVDKLLARA
jgi:hypothetical protein